MPSVPNFQISSDSKQWIKIFPLTSMSFGSDPLWFSCRHFPESSNSMTLCCNAALGCVVPFLHCLSMLLAQTEWNDSFFVLSQKMLLSREFCICWLIQINQLAFELWMSCLKKIGSHLVICYICYHFNRKKCWNVFCHTLYFHSLIHHCRIIKECDESSCRSETF